MGCRGGCSNETQPQPVPKDLESTSKSPKETTGVDLAALESVQDKMKSAVAQMRDITKSQERLTKEMAAKSREFRKAGGLNAVPTTPSPDALQSALKEHAKEHDLELSQWSFSTVKRKGLAPPKKSYDGEGPYPFEQEQLLEEHEILFGFQAKDQSQRDKFLGSIPEKVDRIVRFDRVVGDAGAVSVTATAFSFSAVVAPKRKFTAPTAARKFSAAGFPPSGPMCAGEPKCDQIIVNIKRLNTLAVSLHEGVERARSVEAELNLWVARSKVLMDLIQERDRANAATLQR